MAQESNRSRVRFLQGAGLTNLWLVLPFAFALALFCCLSHFRSVVRSPSCLRSIVLATTGSRPSDSPRVIINIDRASRDLAYFFYHLPVDRISWAFPYVPPGLFTQLVISRSSELQAALDPVAARFTLLRRPAMGRINPQPQATGAASSSTAAAAATAPAEGPQDQEASASPGEVVGTAPSAETTGQELEEVSEPDPPLAPRVATGISSSQPTLTPPGSVTAGAEEFEEDQQFPVSEPTTEDLPAETSTLESLSNRQEPDLNLHTPTAEAELQTGTAASRL